MGIEIIKGSTGILPGTNVPGTNVPGNIKDGKAVKTSGVSSLDDDNSYAIDNVKTKENVNEAIEKLKHVGEIFNRRLDFRVDEETNRVVVKVVDTTTDKVIKEIPPEQLLQLAARIQEMIGILVDEER
jgi:flagellar protein FlaG